MEYKCQYVNVSENLIYKVESIKKNKYIYIDLTFDKLKFTKHSSVHEFVDIFSPSNFGGSECFVHNNLNIDCGNNTFAICVKIPLSIFDVFEIIDETIVGELIHTYYLEPSYFDVTTAQALKRDFPKTMFPLVLCMSKKFKIFDFFTMDNAGDLIWGNSLNQYHNRIHNSTSIYHLSDYLTGYWFKKHPLHGIKFLDGFQSPISHSEYYRPLFDQRENYVNCLDDIGVSPIMLNLKDAIEWTHNREIQLLNQRIDSFKFALNNAQHALNMCSLHIEEELVKFDLYGEEGFKYQIT